MIAGMGRFGQIVNRLLVANEVKTVALDVRADQVDNMRQIGTKAFFGDASKPDILHTAGIEETKLLVVAIDNQEASIELVKYVKHTYPHVKILTRAFDRGHGYQLRQAGADYIESETYHSALELGAKTMNCLGSILSLSNSRKPPTSRLRTNSLIVCTRAGKEALKVNASTTTTETCLLN